jgi:hypothetical protein
MTPSLAYKAGIALAVAASLFIIWVALGLGIVGIEGDPYDLMYLGIIAVAIAGAFVARFHAEGLAWAMAVTAACFVPAAIVALVAGKHEADYSSVAEILGLNGMFATLFLGAGWLFYCSAQGRTLFGRRG